MHLSVQRIPWKTLLLFGVLLLFEFSIHPLTFGPDRRIHDPAVYRLDNPRYLPGDWYTDMATQSGVYTFYAKLVSAWHLLPIHEETWRLFLYLACLAVLYFSMIRIARIFSKSFLVVPIVAVFHAIVVLIAPPIWLYGPFIQIDGGLAPRSIGIALSFLALYFLLKNRGVLPWALLGIATLFHVSNSLIVFTLFFAAWFWSDIWAQKDERDRRYWRSLARKSVLAFMIYMVAGGWFVLYVANLGSVHPNETGFSSAKAIWTWIYFRAPYMALPLMPWKAWLLFLLHAVSIPIAWHFLRKQMAARRKKALDLLGLVGMGAFVYFFIFYLFAFVWPWLPGFQFYSIRVIYFMHFVSYLFVSLLLLSLCRTWWRKSRGQSVRVSWHRVAFTVLAIAGISSLYFSAPGTKFLETASGNLLASWLRISDSNNRTIGFPQSTTEKYLFQNPEPFLAPPNWSGSSTYLPSVANFKSFGFTPQGLAEWYDRMNDVSRGALERTYAAQVRSGRSEPVTIDWTSVYATLTPEDVTRLAEKYGLRLFLAYGNRPYPFPVVAEDGRFRLYRVLEDR
jgi:hypothetical protein